MKIKYFFNNAENYSNVNADRGYDVNRIKDTVAFAIQDNEEVYEITPPSGYVPFDVIHSMLDEIDSAMIAENGKSTYLTSLQHYQLLGLRGFSVKRQGVNNRLEKLVKHHLLRSFEIRREGSSNGIRFYAITGLALKLALEQGVIFHMGNRVQRDDIPDAETVKRKLVANMAALGLMFSCADMEGFAFNETVRPVQEQPITNNCILRTPGMFWLDDESVFLLEVIRSTPHAFRKLTDKVQRYYALVNNEDYLKSNVHGHKAMPQLVICAESMEHARKADAYLRSRGLWSSEDTLLYTHDLVFMKDTLRVFYELNEEGMPIWYSVPSRFSNPNQLCA